MRVVAIIQARMGSTRLSGKVLRDIYGETMLSRVVHRAKRATLLNDIMVATTVKLIDEAVVAEATRLGVPFFRGSEDDVLDRYYQAAIACRADVVVRITSDCPLIEPTIIDMVVRAFLNANPDYASNTLIRTYPRGLDIEAMSLSALTVAWREASKPYQRTHVTPYIYENPHLFRLLSVTGSSDYSRYRWTVDTPEDLEFVREIYYRLSHNSSFDWHDVLELCEREPALTELNSHIKQKPLEKG
jgi:spore coat polysaccharide biosynthesis protein SpsF